MIEDPSPESWPVVRSEEHYSNWLATVRTDRIRMPDDSEADRTVVSHLSAVGIVALDGDNRVLMIRQYRHPIGRQLWEIPAGLRDAAGEALEDTARRELLEETGYAARDWNTLVDFYTSPGITDERIRIFLARGLHAEKSGYVRENEEKYLVPEWVSLVDAVQQAFNGKIHQGLAVQGIMAAYIALQSGPYLKLRPADAPEEE